MELVIFYKKPHDEITYAEVCPYSDATFKITSIKDYGHSGIVLGLMLKATRGEKIWQVIEWKSSKQRRVSH